MPFGKTLSTIICAVVAVSAAFAFYDSCQIHSQYSPDTYGPVSQNSWRGDRAAARELWIEKFAGSNDVSKRTLPEFSMELPYSFRGNVSFFVHALNAFGAEFRVAQGGRVNVNVTDIFFDEATRKLVFEDDPLYVSANGIGVKTAAFKRSDGEHHQDQLIGEFALVGYPIGCNPFFRM